MNSRENVIVCDCKADEIASLCSSLNSKGSVRFSAKSYIANWKRTGRMSELKRYFKYFSVAWKYFLHRKRYDTVIGWQQFYALIFSFYCSVFHVKKQNTLIALNFTYKEKSGKIGRVYHWFMRKCVDVRYLDYIHVPSQNYAEETSRVLNFPLERIIVIPFGINDPYERFVKLPYPESAPKEGYALSIGRSNRDFEFLMRSWESVQYPLVIISDTYSGPCPENPNIRIIKDVAGEQSYPWIAHCKAMIIPIDDGRICSGDTVLLTSMAMRKKVLVTGLSTLAEMYVVHEENGLVCEKDEVMFRTYISDMLFTDRYDGLEEASRESYLQNYSRASMGTRVYDCVFGS